MSHHTIDISAPSCSITCKSGQLICRVDGEPDKRLPMEDIGAVLINSFSASVHNRVFLEATRQGTVVIFCENFRPAAVLLPANRATDTLLTRAQIELSEAKRKALWFKTVTAKCTGQALYAERLCPSAPQTSQLKRAAGSKRPDKEARCARLYWAVLSQYLDLDGFKRERFGGGLNNLLNYGYTVLLARVLQRALAVGLDPTFGVGHVVRERATPLAYDLMEPFRVAVDARIVAWVDHIRQLQGLEGADEEHPSPAGVSPGFKKWIQEFCRVKAPYGGSEIAMERIIEQVLGNFREAVRSGKTGAYRPWTPGNTKWVGFS